MIKDPLIRHAITPPAFDKRMIHRAQLVDRLHANIPRKLIAIAAPAGYGKTTLLADFAAHTELPVCWVRLSEAERDPIRMAKILSASMEKRFRRLKDQLDLGALANASPETLAHAFTSAIDELIGEAFVIAFDDVHLLNDSDMALTFLDGLLKNLPEQATVISAGREVMEVSLARIMAAGDLAGIGPDELALTRDELVELVGLRLGVELDQDEAEKLMAETEGWVTGVLLSGTISRKSLGSLVGTSQPLVYEYLASVVLNRLPDEMRRFLLDSSIVPVMSAKTCDTVLDRTDSAKLLSRLTRRGLFITASADTPRTYHYHPKFREFLLESLEASDVDRLARLRARAGEFYADSELPELAVELFIEGGAFAKAADTAKKHVSEIYRSGELQTLERWASVLEQASIQVPILHLYIGLSHVDRNDYGAAKTNLELASRSIDSNADALNKVLSHLLRAQVADAEERYEEVLEAVNRVDAFADAGIAAKYLAEAKKIRARAIASSTKDYEAAERIMHEAVALLSDADDQYALAAALSELAEFQHGAGKSFEGYRSTGRAVRAFREIGSSSPLSTALHNHAISAHLLGNYEQAVRLWQEAMKHVRRAYSPGREADFCFAQGFLFNNLGLAVQAADLYDKALALAAKTENVPQLRWGFTQSAILHRRNGSDSIAMQWLKRAIRLSHPEQPPAFVQVEQAALEAKVRPDRGLERFQSLLAGESEPLDIWDRTYALHFQFRTVLEQGDEERAQTLLEQLSAWTVSNGTVQLVASEIALDPVAMQFAMGHAAESSALRAVLERIERMQAFVQKYPGKEEQPEPAPRLRIRAFGRAEIQLGSEQALKPLAREILFYLLDRGSAARDVLLETFWPEIPPGRQVSNLHTAIYSIRRALGREAIDHDGAVYRLIPSEQIDFDVDHFERAARAAARLPIGDPKRMFALNEAVDAYAGPFLPDFTSNWVIDRRRELEIRYLDLLAAYSEEALAHDDPQRAVASLREALQIDPYRDDTNRQYLEALGVLGRRTEIIRHYQKYSQLLVDELDLEPSEEFRTLYRRLIS
jgi:ATP/maltotriose-dependent transcriptional regulator MalT